MQNNVCDFRSRTNHGFSWCAAGLYGWDGFYDGRVDDSGWDYDPEYGTGRLVLK